MEIATTAKNKWINSLISTLTTGEDIGLTGEFSPVVTLLKMLCIVSYIRFHKGGQLSIMEDLAINKVPAAVSLGALWLICA